MDIAEMAMWARARVKAWIDWAAIEASIEIADQFHTLAERQNQRLDALQRELKKGQA